MSSRRNTRLSISQGMSGYFVILIADFEDMGWETDIIITGIGRYKERESAISEMKEWSNSEKIPIDKSAYAS